MALSRVFMLDLTSLMKLLWHLVSASVTLIIPFLFIETLQELLFWPFMLIDMLLTRSDQSGMEETKEYLKQHFVS